MVRSLGQMVRHHRPMCIRESPSWSPQPQEATNRRRIANGPARDSSAVRMASLGRSTEAHAKPSAPGYPCRILRTTPFKSSRLRTAEDLAAETRRRKARSAFFNLSPGAFRPLTPRRLHSVLAFSLLPLFHARTSARTRPPQLGVTQRSASLRSAEGPMHRRCCQELISQGETNQGRFIRVDPEGSGIW
jgi:hypothetical protein